jgi:hypothetical protein
MKNKRIKLYRLKCRRYCRRDTRNIHMEDNRTQKDESKRKLSSVFLFSNVSRKKRNFLHRTIDYDRSFESEIADNSRQRTF